MPNTTFALKDDQPGHERLTCMYEDLEGKERTVIQLLQLSIVQFKTENDWCQYYFNRDITGILQHFCTGRKKNV